MRITDDWLTAPHTQAVFAALAAGGARALAVGGCVRDALLGRAVADIDIATDARPDRVVALAQAAGLRTVPTGIDHGTVTVLSGGLPHEVTTFRRDEETDGRRATVAFSDDLTEDAARRDFTMNALYADATGAIIDPLGGLPDLHARHVRFIGDPAARIAEDYLRILRFFRFTAWHGDPALGLDAEGLAACARMQDGLSRLSAERVGQEIRKLLSAPDPAPAMAAMARTGILARVLPGAQAEALPLLINAEDGPPDWRVRLALLGGDVTGLRLSKADARTVHDLATRARDGTAPFALGHLMGAARAQDALAIRAALTQTAPDPAALDTARRGAAMPFPLAAADLMPALSGPALGRGLERARTLWLSRGGNVSPEALIAAARGDAAP
ncbi:CCA tRNA nucleotidyltransferase [Jannaschia rubra]|uniref:CCA-adding enzyme n=1 Tax=Jannaschia rubra TaxID=282197 RepID=A0A0M6XN67_9RHOB|nr:CCA tRNA nucleotidyltransferase [Jannaschia rubra]CTQ32529.1 CCA-adding enzyme [Jannaschia rubra]SFF84246.1 poly(A) polymerase [Jannaschia rubra]